MKKYNSNIPLISIHIPKCGGTSFKTALYNWFGNRLYYHYFDEKKGCMPTKYNFKRWYSKHFIKNCCVYGHFNSLRNFGVDDYYPNLKQAITFIRDPLEIQLSIFHYNLRMSKEGINYRDGKLVEFTQDIDQYLESSTSYVKYFLPQGINSNNIDEYFSNYFVHVGVMEYYQDSMDNLANKIGKPKVVISHENKSERIQTPSQSSINIFKQRCLFEYKFYKKALKENNLM